MILSLWEERFGYPVPTRSDDGEARYSEDAMVALRDALDRELSISSAITEARRMQPARRHGSTRWTDSPDGLVMSLESPGEAH
jgi:hypothetical protein